MLNDSIPFTEPTRFRCVDSSFKLSSLFALLSEEQNLSELTHRASVISRERRHDIYTIKVSLTNKTTVNIAYTFYNTSPASFLPPWPRERFPAWIREGCHYGAAELTSHLCACMNNHLSTKCLQISRVSTTQFVSKVTMHCVKKTYMSHQQLCSLPLKQLRCYRENAKKIWHLHMLEMFEHV